MGNLHSRLIDKNLKDKLIKKIECIHPTYIGFFKTMDKMAKSYQKLIIGEAFLVFFILLVIIFLIYVMVCIIDNPEQPILPIFVGICSMGIILGINCEQVLDSYDRYEFYNQNRMKTFKDFLR